MGYTNRSYQPRRSFGFRPAPVELGKEYEADIIEMSRRGDAGVAKIQGFVIFVSEAKRGDHVKFVITKVGRRYATANIVPKETAQETEDEEAEEEKSED